MQDDFETVVNPETLGGDAAPVQEKKLTNEALAVLMSGVNQMGPGMPREEQAKEEPVVKL